jgi:uncharacterized protein YabE (DUF348 family)
VLRSVKYGLNGAVLAGLIAVPALWNTVDKHIELVVDGQPRAIETTAQTVGQVLHGAGYRVTSHDLLAPAASSQVSNGTHIVLRRGRLLRLSVDGVQTSVWTTAPTVAEALAQLGYPAADFVSVSRSRRLPLGVTDIAIRTPQLVTIVYDGHTEQVTTTDATVGQMLADLGIDVGAADRISVPTDSAVTAGETVRVQRVSKQLVTRTQQLPFPVVKRLDAAMRAGTTKVITPGKPGQVLVTYALVYVDGRLVGSTKVRSVVISRPQRQVVRVGTKPAPPITTLATAAAPTVPAPSPGTAKAIARQLLSDRGWGAGQYDCLVALWDRESSWNVHAANPSGAYGIPQALPGSKMATAGPDWQDNATTQIKWGLGYIASRYGTPCGAWSSWQANGWY